MGYDNPNQNENEGEEILPTKEHETYFKDLLEAKAIYAAKAGTYTGYYGTGHNARMQSNLDTIEQLEANFKNNKSFTPAQVQLLFKLVKNAYKTKARAYGGG